MARPPRPRMLLIAVLLAAIPVLAPAADEDELPRVIVRADRYTETMGYVELEDDDVIVVRTRSGKVASFAKDRVLGIVRLVSPGPRQPGVVVLRNGALRDGIIIEDAFDYVLVEIEGVRAKLKREVVDHVVLEPTFEQRYEQFKVSIGPGMAERHLSLCQWLVEEKRYDLAKNELEELLANHPDLPEALRLSTIVRAQIALRDRPPKPETEGEVEPNPRDKPTLPENLLTDADVNMIRVYELDFRRPPRIAISRETISRIIEDYATSEWIPASQTERQQLYKAEPIQIVQLLFNLRARELYGEIEVLSEPHALNLFRQRVHNTWLINNCATSRCHGGTDAGRLFLHRRKYKEPRVRYTNLLILERLVLNEQWPLVNYDDPMDSLLIQHGLPRDHARMPHPPVKGWKPAFRRPTDRMVRDFVQWTQAMLKPRPDYPIQFTPPVPGGADPAAPEAPATPDRTGR